MNQYRGMDVNFRDRRETFETNLDGKSNDVANEEKPKSFSFDRSTGSKVRRERACLERIPMISWSSHVMKMSSSPPTSSFWSRRGPWGGHFLSKFQNWPVYGENIGGLSYQGNVRAWRYISCEWIVTIRERESEACIEWTLLNPRFTDHLFSCWYDNETDHMFQIQNGRAPDEMEVTWLLSSAKREVALALVIEIRW